VDDAILAVIKAAKYGSLMGVASCSAQRRGRSSRIRTRSAASLWAMAAQGQSWAGCADGAVAGQMFIGTPDVRTSYMIYDAAQEGKRRTSTSCWIRRS